MASTANQTMAAAATGMLRIRAITAAASGPNKDSAELPRPMTAPGTVSVPSMMPPVADRAPDSAQMTVETVPTLMPRRAARSAFSDRARTATPTLV